MTKFEKIKSLCDNKKYCKLNRQIENDFLGSNCGFIIDYSESFIVFKEVDDFIVRGNLIIPIDSVVELRRNKNDMFVERIYKLEGITETINNENKIELKSWESIFKSIQKIGFNVIVKDEKPNEDSFDIGPIIKVTKTNVSIQYFNACGILEDEPTKIKWNQITLVHFDDIYTNIYSKYIKSQTKNIK